MSKSLFLIKYGEISLKGKNQPQFIQQLVANIRQQLSPLAFRLIIKQGRIYLECEGSDTSAIETGLGRVFGIVSFAPACRTEKFMPAITGCALTCARQALAGRERMSFKIECRRTDKRFHLSSYQIACQLGDTLCKTFPALYVDVRSPDWLLSIEIREQAYLYGPQTKGLGGLPVGCTGKGLCLLSGGIDSPVAGFMMAKRGLNLDAVYFHTHPFTSEGAKQKAIDCARLLKSYIPDLRLFVVNFTDIQIAIKQKAIAKAVTLMSRAGMMRIADALARKEGTSVLITGECLGQVASQTPESLAFTSSFTNLPILRPLIGMDKVEIIDQARRLGTYEISTRPFDDCCTIFAPEHPLIKPDTGQLTVEYNDLGLEILIEKAADSAEKLMLD